MKPPVIDRLIRSKRKTIALILRPDGSLEVRAPLHLPEKDILEWVAMKSKWIEKHRQLVLQTQAEKARLAGRNFQNGDLVYVMGKTYPLRVIQTSMQTLRLEKNRLVMSSDLLPHARTVLQKFLSKHLNLALALRLPKFIDQVGKQPAKVRVSQARTRWGSCSSNGNIAFNWRLAMAPSEILDYIIVHELMHLKHPNHSRAFWADVARILPDYNARKQWLKQYGTWLTLEHINEQPLPSYQPAAK
ncbi:MAG: metal-dependent hydrolase [Bellilinea sp.]|nr:MAG: metal-dependent hydrolase [Bellilinea sp.]